MVIGGDTRWAGIRVGCESVVVSSVGLMCGRAEEGECKEGI